tara:strand:+ start:70 stop:237 length:168 start_codon:yes stop_codon:yes gene_type:complete
MVTDGNQTKQPTVLRALLVEERMTKYSRHLQLVNWSVIDGKLHWKSKKKQWEELE